MSAYPGTRQFFRLVLIGGLLVPFLVGQIVGSYSQQIGLLFAELSVVGVLALSIRQNHWAPDDLMLLNATSGRALLATAGTAVCASFVIAEIDQWCNVLLSLARLDLPLPVQRGLIEVQLFRDLPNLPLLIASVVLAPGLCEELFFRGFVFTALLVARGSRAALLGSALLFAVVHLRPWQLPALFLFGFYLACLVYLTHSIYPAILAHLTNNLLSVASVNLKAHLGISLIDIDRHLPALVALLASFVLAWGLWWLSKQPPIVPLPRSQQGGYA